MPTAPTYPGVYIEEVPSGVRTIVGAATSVAAFIDRFRRGPVNVPVRVLGMGDFERDFGGLERASEASYGIRQFFLNGGSQAWVVRVPAEDADTASATLTGDGADIVNVFAGRQVGRDSFRDPGGWGNGLRLEIDYDTTDPATLFNLTVSETAEDRGRMVVRQSETYRNLTMLPGAPFNAIAVVNAASRLIQLNRAGLADVPEPFEDTFRPDATGTRGAAPSDPPGAGTAVVADGSTLTITVNPGGGAADNDDVTATIDYDGEVPDTYAAFRPFLESAIRAADPNEPLLAGASVRLVGGRFVVLLGRSGADFEPDAQVTFTGGAADTLGLGAGATVNDQMIPLENGEDGDLPGDAELRGVRNDKTGIFALENADLFNLLCIPRAADLDGNAMRSTYGEALAYCQERRAFLLIDIPADVDDVNAMETWLNENAGLRHRNSAVWFPRVRVADPLNRNRLRSIGASGTMAGVCAATDARRGVWKAPAGTESRLQNVQALDYTLTDSENGVLNPLAVNCLRNFPVYGLVAWGARTLDGADVQASEWKYIPVRRFALYLEESLFRGTKWVVFEPNDEPLWSQIRLNIGAFMQNLFRQGAFQGSTPRDAYFVKCDAQTTTQDDINRGIVNIVVGFAPLKPAEFVIIRIQQLAGNVEA